MNVFKCENNQITPLEFEDSYKDLGVTFDEKLTFQDHIHEKVHKAYAMLEIIKRNFKYISINNFILLMVRSLLDYCVSVWVSYNKGDIEVQVASRSSEVNFTKNYTLLYLYFSFTRESSEEGNQDYSWNKTFATQGSIPVCT